MKNILLDTNDLGVTAENMNYILSSLLVAALAAIVFLSILTFKIRRRRLHQEMRLKAIREMRLLFLKHIGQYLRIPLKTILQSCNTLREQEPANALSEDESHALLQDIYKSSHLIGIHLNELQELWNFDGNIPAVSTIEVNLAELIMSYRREILREVNRGVIVKIHCDMPLNSKATLDSPIFHLLMMQLLRICAIRTQKGSIAINYSWEREGLRFKIEDTGGVVPEEYDKILSGQQVSDWNTMTSELQRICLKLRICKDLINAVHGNFTVSATEEYKGMVIDFWIPCYVRFS